MTNDNSNKQNLPEKDVVLKDVEISNDSVVSENASEKEDLIVEIKGLYKKYAKAADFVIHDINIECRSGEIVGLLGKNGAGKSTTIKCLTGFFPFDKGEIKICGHDIKTEPVKAKMNLGYVPDNRAMFDKMTGTEYINFIADLHKTPVEDRVARIDEMQKIFVLGDKIDALISSYSYGMRQKICMMGSVIHRPKLWILDEPMIGLDPLTSAKVAAFMKEYALNGNAILFSSHNINSVEKICKRAVIIQGGQKTDDFVIRDFVAQNPGVDLENYFLQKTVLRKTQKEQK